MAYNALALADYLLATGDFRDVLTREPLSDSALKQLDQLVGFPLLLSRFLDCG